MSLPLDGRTVVSLAPNVPGPVAVARLRDLGATVTKIESPGGDLLATAAPGWYARLHDRVAILTLDLKAPHARAELDAHLAAADLLVTSTRPRGLAALGLAWDGLHARFPRLSHVAIVGDPPPDADRAGHDLTYAARAGLLAGDAMPRTLVADLGGAARAVEAALAALLARARTNEGSLHVVSLAQAARDFAAPFDAGLTAPGGVLAGGFAGYRIYRARDGYVALAALEPHFFKRACDDLLGPSASDAHLAHAFAQRDAHDWEIWANERDVPLAALRETHGT